MGCRRTGWTRIHSDLDLAVDVTQMALDHLLQAFGIAGRRLTVGGARSALPAERLIFTAALARSTADSSPAVYSTSSTPPLNPVMY